MKAAVAFALATAAGAVGVLSPSAGAVDSTCASNHAVTDPVLSIDGDVATFSGGTRPGCEGAPVFLASHATAHTSFNPDEIQPLINSVTGVAGPDGVLLSLTLQLSTYGGQCVRQVDAGVGGVLDEVSPTSRYNELAIGSDSDGDGLIVNRLAAAKYAEGVCETELVEAVSTPTPAPTPASWPPPVHPVHPDFPLEQRPPAPTPPPPPHVELSARPPVGVQNVSVDRLPVTGRPSATLALWGIGLIGLGMSLCFSLGTALTPQRRTK